MSLQVGGNSILAQHLPLLNLYEPFLYLLVYLVNAVESLPHIVYWVREIFSIGVTRHLHPDKIMTRYDINDILNTWDNDKVVALNKILKLLNVDKGNTRCDENKKLLKRLQQCQSDTKEIRTLSYRVLYHLITPSLSKHLFTIYCFDVFIIRYLYTHPGL